MRWGRGRSGQRERTFSRGTGGGEGLLGAKLGLDIINLHLQNAEPDLINRTCWRARRVQ